MAEPDEVIVNTGRAIFKSVVKTPVPGCTARQVEAVNQLPPAVEDVATAAVPAFDHRLEGIVRAVAGGCEHIGYLQGFVFTGVEADAQGVFVHASGTVAQTQPQGIAAADAQPATGRGFVPLQTATGRLIAPYPEHGAAAQHRIVSQSGLRTHSHTNDSFECIRRASGFAGLQPGLHTKAAAAAVAMAARGSGETGSVAQAPGRPQNGIAHQRKAQQAVGMADRVRRQFHAVQAVHRSDCAEAESKGFALPESVSGGKNRRIAAEAVRTRSNCQHGFRPIAAGSCRPGTCRQAVAVEPETAQGGCWRGHHYIMPVHACNIGRMPPGSADALRSAERIQHIRIAQTGRVTVAGTAAADLHGVNGLAGIQAQAGCIGQGHPRCAAVEVLCRQGTGLQGRGIAVCRGAKTARSALFRR